MLGHQEVRPVPYIASSRDARPPRSPPSTLHRVESRCSAPKKSAQYPTSHRVAMLGPQEVRPVPYIASSRGAQPLRSPPSTLHDPEPRCTAAKKSAQYPTSPRVAVLSGQEAPGRNVQRSCCSALPTIPRTTSPGQIPHTTSAANRRMQQRRPPWRTPLQGSLVLSQNLHRFIRQRRVDGFA